MTIMDVSINEQVHISYGQWNVHEYLQIFIVCLPNRNANEKGYCSFIFGEYVNEYTNGTMTTTTIK